MAVSAQAQSRIAVLMSPAAVIVVPAAVAAAVTSMKKTYCGSCRGERGCSDCRKAVKAVTYTGLTAFFGREELCLSSVVSNDLHGNRECEGNGVTVREELLLAVDIGTTTLAFVCADAKGEELFSYGTENPQRKIAADVIGRVDAAMRGKREILKNEIREALAKGFLFVLERVYDIIEKEDRELPEAVRIAIAGNTVMQHILLDYPVDGLSRAPFLPYKGEGAEITMRELFGETACFFSLPVMVKEAKIIVFPCLSAFVGGDAVAGAYGLFPWAVRKAENDFIKEKEKICLLMDLGTNGELLLWDGKELYGTAAAMGSAFEGGKFAFASDLFRILSKSLQQGVLDETGLLREPYFSEGFEGVEQEEIREFQLAKGALRAGIELLCKYAGVESAMVEQVYIAGGFGQFCKKEDLFVTGLLPTEFIGKVSVVGNSCIGGLLRFLQERKAVPRPKGTILNLAEQSEFEEVYYRYMDFKVHAI